MEKGEVKLANHTFVWLRSDTGGIYAYLRSESGDVLENTSAWYDTDSVESALKEGANRFGFSAA